LYPPATRTDTGNAGGPINPVLIGGSDYAGSPELRNIKVDSSGNIYVGGTVSVTGSVSVSGTVGVTQSTSPWVVSLASTSITGSVAVTGTFWQATQPVSGTVSVSNFPATQAVTQSGSWTVGLSSGSNLVGQVEVSDGTNVLLTSSHPGYVQFGSAQHVIVDSGGGGGTQYVNNAVVANPTGTLALGYDGTVLRALPIGLAGSPSVEALNVNVVAGGFSGSSVAVSNFPAIQDSCLFAGNIPLTATAYGSPAEQGLNVYVLNPLSVTFPSSMPVTQATSPWITIPADEALASQFLTFSVNTGTAAVSVTTQRPILSIQAQTGSSANSYLLRKLRLLGNGSTAFYQLILNGSLSGASFVSADPSSFVNYDVSATSISGGRVVDSGYLSFGGADPEYTLHFGFVGPTPDILSLVVTSMSSSAIPVSGSFRWSLESFLEIVYSFLFI
jgi:hypothetical protein